MQGLNRFAYVNNNPINYNDPTGHYMEGACGFGGGECGKSSNEGYDTYQSPASSDDTANDPLENDIENGNNTYQPLNIPDWVPETTKNYLEVGNQAWWIFTHPEASVKQKAVAYGWLAVNATAWTTLAAGLGILSLYATGAITTTVTAASADGDPTNEVVAVVNALNADGDPTNEVTSTVNGLSGTWAAPYTGSPPYLQYNFSQGGFNFSNHALTRMAPVGYGGRGIPTSVVLNVLNNGNPITSHVPNSTGMLLDGIKVFYNPNTMRIITIYYSSKP